jgi:hypothetical protein
MIYMVHQSCGCVFETSLVDNSASGAMHSHFWHMVCKHRFGCIVEITLIWTTWHMLASAFDACGCKWFPIKGVLHHYDYVYLCLYILVYWSLFIGDDCSNPHWGNPVVVWNTISWNIMDFWWVSWRVRLSVRFLVDMSAVDCVQKLICELLWCVYYI